MEIPIIGLQPEQARIEGTHPHYSLIVLGERGHRRGVADVVSQVDWGPPYLICLVEPVYDGATTYPYLSLLPIVYVSHYLHLRGRGAADQSHRAIEVLADLTRQSTRAVTDQHHAGGWAPEAQRGPSGDCGCGVEQAHVGHLPLRTEQHGSGVVGVNRASGEDVQPVLGQCETSYHIRGEPIIGRPRAQPRISYGIVPVHPASYGCDEEMGVEQLQLRNRVAREVVGGAPLSVAVYRYGDAGRVADGAVVDDPDPAPGGGDEDLVGEDEQVSRNLKQVGGAEVTLRPGGLADRHVV